MIPTTRRSLLLEVTLLERTRKWPEVEEESPQLLPTRTLSQVL